MAAYVIVQINGVNNPAGLGEYREKVGPIIQRYGGTIRIVGGQVDVLEGDWRPVLVMLEFENAERARAWYDSPEYRPLKELRQGSADCDMIVVEGI